METSQVDRPGLVARTGAVGGEFSSTTAVLNQSVCRMRMLVGRLESNFEQIDTVYEKVSLGGMARQCSALVTEAAEEIATLQGLCWAAINEECADEQKLSIDDWEKVGSQPPAWLREVFESALILNGMPDEETLARIAERGQVLVVRAPELRGGGLLPQTCAIMPAGFGASATMVWWPWVMGGETPVVLEEADQVHVLREITSNVFLEGVLQSAEAGGS